MNVTLLFFFNFFLASNICFSSVKTNCIKVVIYCNCSGSGRVVMSPTDASFQEEHVHRAADAGQEGDGSRESKQNHLLQQLLWWEKVTLKRLASTLIIKKK